MSEYIQRLLSPLAIRDGALPLVSLLLLCLAVALLAWLLYMLCLKIVSPFMVRMARRTSVEWDDYLLTPATMRAVSHMVPPLVVWLLAPPLFAAYPLLQALVAKASAVYAVIMAMRLAITLIGSVKLFDSASDKRTAAQQYLHSLCGVLKIIILFLGVIVIVSVLVGRSPLTLIAGLGATSAVLMLVFKDSIIGLVAGIRLTSNNMVCKGDWIQMDRAGINGIVEDITLSTVKVRNFDQTIVTIPPQKLIEESFQNWNGMQEGEGRRVKRVLYIDFGSIATASPQLKRSLLEGGYMEEAEMRGDVVNLTLFRRYVERMLATRDDVLPSLTYFVRQLQPTNAGLPIEIYFFLKQKEWKPYEHHLAEIMERVYALVPVFGLNVYQRL